MTKTLSMTSFKQGDLVLVKFAFTEGIGFKKRPALVVSSNEYHKSRNEIVIAAVTSNMDRELVGDTRIKEWKKANLLHPSVVTGILQTMKYDRIERKLGTLMSEDFQRVQENLKCALSL